MTKAKNTRKALVFSALSVLLCLSLLIGATFAWFTDTASTAVNKIQAGNLDVALEMKDESGNWVSAEGETLNFVKAQGAEGEPILWEPGCTYRLPELRIINEGNLALKYKVLISGILGDAKLNEAIEWTIKLDEADFDLAGEFHLGAGDSDVFTIEGHMKEEAGNEYQNLSIDGIAITVIATQDTVESDSFNYEYDKDAVYPVITVDEVQAAVAAGGYVSVGVDITVPEDKLSSSGYGVCGIAQTNGGVIDGNGHEISAPGASTTWDATIYTKGGTIKNAVITGGFRGIFIAYPNEDIFVDNVVINPVAYTVHCDAGNGKNLVVTNSTLNGWTSFAGTLASATFTNCYFGTNGSYAYLRPYCPTTLVNCAFAADFEMDATKSSQIILKNCTYDGNLITQANLTNYLGADAAYAIVQND